MHLDGNGEVLEALLEEKELVCLNDGRSTRIDAHTGRESVLDLTLVSNTLARKCHWEVWEGSCIGSDHYSIVTSVGIEAEKASAQGGGRWMFGKADCRI